MTGKPKFGIVIEAKTEECETFTTYNFEVADFHTYYVGENGVCVHNCCDEALLQQKALAARDAKVAELRNTLSPKELRKVATVVDGYNKATGNIAVGVKTFGSGNFCAEALVVKQLGGMQFIHDIVMTAAIRPYNLAVIPVCNYCQTIYSMSNFMPGTIFRYY